VESPVDFRPAVRANRLLASCEAPLLVIRWLRFNAVGIAGVTVQLSLLWLLVNLARMPYLPATACAVEVALLHNFVWHESWTWRGQTRDGRWRRFLRFHLSSGFLSITGNTLFTWCFKQSLGLPLLPANLAAIAVTSLLNFAVASMWVFDSRPTHTKTS
jgi:putative flippase GtrA